jgi:hypothetical protein
VLLGQPLTDLFGLSEEQAGGLNLQLGGNMVRMLSSATGTALTTDWLGYVCTGQCQWPTTPVACCVLGRRVPIQAGCLLAQPGGSGL